MSLRSLGPHQHARGLFPTVRSSRCGLHNFPVGSLFIFGPFRDALSIFIIYARRCSRFAKTAHPNLTILIGRLQNRRSDIIAALCYRHNGRFLLRFPRITVNDPLS